MFDSFKVQYREWLEEHPQIEALITSVRGWLPPVNYITIHYGYFIAVIAASSLIFWGSSSPFGNVDYVDSLFLVTSAMTNTGLNTRNLSEMTTWQQVQLWFLLMIGSPIWVSFWTVMIRKRAFERRFEDIVETERQRRKQMREQRKHSAGIKRAQNLGMMMRFGKSKSAPHADTTKLPGLGTHLAADNEAASSGLELPRISRKNDNASRAISAPLEPIPPSLEETDRVSLGNSETTVHPAALAPAQDHRDHITFAEQPDLQGIHKHESRVSAYSHGNQHMPALRGRRSSDATMGSDAESENFIMHWKKFLGAHNTSRSGQFYDLSSDEREHLGGCEYRALKILAVAVPLYSALWQFLGAVALACWIATRQPEIPRADGENPWWAGIFYSVSAFNNGGFTLVNDSVIPFQSDYFVLFAIGLLILAGNTAYPIFLRLIFWSILKVLEFTSDERFIPWKETLEFILKYPRRVYTTLFPSRATWWLFAVLLITNIVDWLAFEILNIGNPEVEKLPVGDQIMAGLFQAICKFPSPPTETDCVR